MAAHATTNSDIRSTILFSSESEKATFKRSSADLASCRGLSPSALLSRLPIEQLAQSSLGRKLATVIYGGGSCLDAYARLFEGWSAMQPEGDCRCVIMAFFDYCQASGATYDGHTPGFDALRRDWDALRSLAEIKAHDDEWRLMAKSLAVVSSIHEDVENAGPCGVSSQVSLLLGSWDLVGSSAVTYRVLGDLASVSKTAGAVPAETVESRVALLRAVDRCEGFGE